MALTLISTGGTIASTVNADGSVSATLKGHDLLRRLPERISTGQITGGHPVGRGGGAEPAKGISDLLTSEIQVVDMSVPGSWNLSTGLAHSIAEEARRALSEGSEGVVVTHGTDVLEETAWLAELIVGRHTDLGPVVFTASMRHADEFGGDGPRNLADSLLLAADPGARSRGVLICLNGEIHHARWATKWHTTALSTFVSPGRGPLGEVGAAGPRFFSPSPPPPPSPTTGPDGTALLGGDVAIVTSQWDANPRLIPWLLDEGAQGIVIEGGGAGNINGNLVDGVADALHREIPVVVTSRCRAGRVEPIYGGRGGFATLAASGVIGSNGLSAGKARLALQVAIGVAQGANSAAAESPVSTVTSVGDYFRALDTAD